MGQGDSEVMPLQRYYNFIVIKLFTEKYSNIPSMFICTVFFFYVIKAEFYRNLNVVVILDYFRNVTKVTEND